MKQSARPHTLRNHMASGFHHCSSCSHRPDVDSAGAQGALVGLLGRREAEKSLLLSQGGSWPPSRHHRADKEVHGGSCFWAKSEVSCLLSFAD